MTPRLVRPMCACGCPWPVPRPRAKYLNRAHCAAHRARTGNLAACGSLGGSTAAKAKRRAAIVRAAQVCGTPLTAREAAIYRRAYGNGYSMGQKVGEARGYRKGFAEALGERDDVRQTA